MPIYEYRCTACGHQQEFLQKASDAPYTVCTQCGKETFSKMLSAAGFQLKGSGWYATDFKNKGSAPKGDAKAGAGGDSKPGSGGDSKASGSAEGGGDGGKKAAPAGCGCH
ncbi:MAG TPA: zinc ribbon domain-containing protein [Usitatibacter sp.]|jgi:putative FmdB family regulatory protein|nr:zinc ribbon domain-containing protein [Usitatibacter sp.]